jgi:hypothetical protein
MPHSGSHRNTRAALAFACLFILGGAIAAFMAVADPGEIPAATSRLHPGFSDTVQEAAGFSAGRYDLLAARTGMTPAQEKAFVDAWGSPESGTERWRRAGPISYVTPGDAPMFFVIGLADGAGRVPQSRRMAAAFAAAGVEHVLVEEPGMDHLLPGNPDTLADETRRLIGAAAALVVRDIRKRKREGLVVAFSEPVFRPGKNSRPLAFICGLSSPGSSTVRGRAASMRVVHEALFRLRAQGDL